MNRRSSRRRSKSTQSGNPGRIKVTTAIVAVLVGLAILGIVGGGGTPPPPPPGNQYTGIQIGIGMDVSASNMDALKSESGILCQYVDGSLPTRSRVIIWAYDRKAYKQYGGRPEGSRDLYRVIDDILAWKSQTTGTSQAAVLQEMLAVAQSAEDQPVGFILLTDGDDCSPDETRALAEKLAALENVKAILVAGIPTGDPKNTGTDCDLRQAVEDVFSAFGDRLVTAGKHDVRDALDDFQNLMGGK